MARPKNLQTKTNFSVIQYGVAYALCYKNRVIRIGERSSLYRERAKYIYWFEKFELLGIVVDD